MPLFQNINGFRLHDIHRDFIFCSNIEKSNGIAIIEGALHRGEWHIDGLVLLFGIFPVPLGDELPDHLEVDPLYLNILVDGIFIFRKEKKTDTTVQY